MELTMRFATIRELDVYYNWAKDPLVRQNSYQTGDILYEQHVTWFNKKLLNVNCYLYYFETGGLPAGQVRIEIGGDETIIGISVANEFRGRSLSVEMLKMSTNDFLQKHPKEIVCAYIKDSNKGSYNAFLKAGFKELEKLEVSGFLSFKLIKQHDKKH